MNAVLKQIANIGIVPVIAIDDVDKAVPLAKALLAGGIPCAEVTFRTAEGEEAIRRMTKEVPEILVGAGTVLTTEQVDRAMDAGATFIVSPGLNPEVVAYCNEKNIPITPGCANPSDVEQAIALGLDVVKFFPAEQAGGLPYIRSMAAPYTNMKFMPTGGVNAKNLSEYLAFDRIIACGGSWMVSKDLISGGKFDEIESLCKEAVHTMLDFHLAHVGINTENSEQAKAGAKLFEKMFGFTTREGEKSVHAGAYVELMNQPGRGENGHIAIGTPHVERAVYHLERQGIVFDHASENKDAKGKLLSIYLEDDVAGFAVHLVKQA